MAHAQLSASGVVPGIYTATGDCLLTDGSLTMRSERHQMTFHYDLAGQMMMVDVLAQLGGASPIGGQIWGGKTYYSTPAGMVLDPDSAIYSIESAGEPGPGSARGYYFDQNAQSWLWFEESQCAADRQALLAANLVEFRDLMAARFEVDLLTEFDAIRNSYARAVSAFQ